MAALIYRKVASMPLAEGRPGLWRILGFYKRPHSIIGKVTMKRSVKFFPALTLLACIAVPAFAAPETYVIDDSHTYPRFSYNHLGFSNQVARFNDTSGKVVFDKQAKTGSVDIVIDMKSVDTGFATFDEHIQAEEFFHTAKYPTATFKSTKVEFEGDKPSKIHGDLTIKGITKPVTLNVTSFQAMPHPMQKKDAIGANAYTVVKRSDFNAAKYAPAVSDEVRIDIALEAIKE
jgi:polyisoprenoid-binding protein YceI